MYPQDINSDGKKYTEDQYATSVKRLTIRNTERPHYFHREYNLLICGKCIMWLLMLGIKLLS